jgi:hypothetical protein
MEKRMKAILEFNLPEDHDTYDVCVNSGKFFSALHDIDGHIRNKLKYDKLDKKTRLILEEIRSMIPHEIHEIG